MSLPVTFPSKRGEHYLYVVESSEFSFSATTQQEHPEEGRQQQLSTNTTKIVYIPALCFGLYMVPNNHEGEQIVINAIDKAGYRNVDSASIYGNEQAVGNGLSKCTSVEERSELFIATKVWNDAQRQGRIAVRKSVEQSLQDLQCTYLDICYIHWPVPDQYVETYRELQILLEEGTIKHIGLSNFTIAEYQQLMSSPGIYVKPLIHQMEVSPFMYRPKLVEYFQSQGILVAASKALHRSANHNESTTIQSIADDHGVSCAQIMLRWSLQKGFMPLSKTSKLERMIENRAIFSFNLTSHDMSRLDALTNDCSITSREQREMESKNW
jgi:diketogulonate reductase-like aldo/keto reductase